MRVRVIQEARGRRIISLVDEYSVETSGKEILFQGPTDLKNPSGFG